ncbi:hypothetical protein [Streptomyces sp. NBC_01361]|uniref:hypothetical protein n=1 Tax=Streptomyces sp. NBC_01361 TaxID=2903838 RepID=UPI002E344861|nr:hypothetical protein [Streptomyces sp. NBC_01361]
MGPACSPTVIAFHRACADRRRLCGVLDGAQHRLGIGSAGRQGPGQQVRSGSCAARKLVAAGQGQVPYGGEARDFLRRLIDLAAAEVGKEG